MNRQEWMLLWLAGSSHHRAGKTETFKQCFTNEYLGKFGVRSLLMIETVKQQVPKKIPKIKTRGSYIIKLLQKHMKLKANMVVYAQLQLYEITRLN